MRYFYLRKHTESQATGWDPLLCCNSYTKRCTYAYMKLFPCVVLKHDLIICWCKCHSLYSVVEIFLQYSTSGFASLTITVRAINQALFSMPPQLTWVYMLMLYRPFYWVIKEWSCLEGCVCTVCVEGIKVSVSVVFSYIEIGSGVYLPVYIFSYSAR